MATIYSRLLSAARRSCKLGQFLKYIITFFFTELLSCFHRDSEALDSPLEQFSSADGRRGGTRIPYYGQLEESGT